MTSQNAIRIKNLQFSFEKEIILKGVNLTLEKGKFYTILGPNGSGKTTLLRNIAKSLPIKTDAIFINERDIQHLGTKSLAKELAMVTQNTAIPFEFSVFDVVLMGRAPYLPRFGMEGEEDLSIVQKAMEITNTWQLRERNITAISGGELQRVIVARAIAQNTGIILLDEPVSHLDIHHQIGLLKQIKELNLNKQVTVLAVLHDLNLAAAFSDWLIIMDGGKIHSHGTPDQILTKEIIKQVYGVEVHIMKAPETGRPYLIPKIDSRRN